MKDRSEYKKSTANEGTSGIHVRFDPLLETKMCSTPTTYIFVHFICAKGSLMSVMTYFYVPLVNLECLLIDYMGY